MFVLFFRIRHTNVVDLVTLFDKLLVLYFYAVIFYRFTPRVHFIDLNRVLQLY